MSAPAYFLFTDIETTGLDEKNDKILEVAWIITDSEFCAVSPPRSFVVKQDESYPAVLASAKPVVLEMHSNNGLFAEVEFATHNLDDVWIQMQEDLLDLPEGSEVQIAGRSVHFDEKFLRANDFGPLFDELLSHRVYDVRSVRTYLDLRGIHYDDIQGHNHRALDDVLGDIEFARHLQAITVY